MASPPFTVQQASPEDDDIVSQFPVVNRANMDNLHDWLEFIADATTGHLTIPIAASPSSGSYPTGALVYDSDLSRLRIRLVGGFANTHDEFPSGTRMVFQQTTAPTGWTKVTDAAYEDAVMLLTTGTVATAGSVAVDEFLIEGDHFNNNEVIGDGTTSSDGAHTHNYSFDSGTTGAGVPTYAGDGNSIFSSYLTSSDGAHTHTFSVLADSNETPMFTEIKTVEFIVCQKD